MILDIFVLYIVGLLISIIIHAYFSSTEPDNVSSENIPGLLLWPILLIYLLLSGFVLAIIKCMKLFHKIFVIFFAKTIKHTGWFFNFLKKIFE